MYTNYILSFLTLLLFFTTGMETYAQKRNGKNTVEVLFTLDDSKEIPRGLSGVSMEVSNTDPFRYDNEDFVTKLKETHVGWVRFFGGTSNNYYDWRLGGITEAFNAQLIAAHQYMCYIGMQSIRGMGGVWFRDYLDMVKKIGSKTIITVNAFTDSPESIADLARYVKNHNIQVEYWQLSNEPWSYLTHDNIPLFTGSADYLDKVKVFHDSIIAIIPDAKTSVFTSVFNSDPHKQWRKEIHSYPNKYWSSITFHDYSGGYGDNKTAAMQSTNNVLKSLVDRLNDRAGKLLHGEGAAISTEWNARFSGRYSNRTSLYGGIYDAEFMMRLIANPQFKVEYLGLYNSIFDLINYKTKYQYDAVSAAELNEVFNTSDKSLADFQVYQTVPGLAMTLANKAINPSNRLIHTELVSDLAVEAGKGETLSAVFGQVFKGPDGYLRLLLTNKSDKSVTLNIRESGKELDKNIKIEHSSLASSDITIRNTGASRDIAISHKTVKGPLNIGGYSVNLIVWKGAETELVQPIFVGKPITFIGKNTVKIDWKEETYISDYELGYVRAEGDTYDEKDIEWIAVKGNSVLFDKLKENSEYVLWVRSVDGDTKGPLSSPLYVSTAVSGETYIDTWNPKQNSVEIKWRFAKDAIGYKISLYDEHKTKIKTIDIVDNLGCEINGLVNNKKYYVSILSYNYYGESRSSALREIITDKTYPLAPHNVVAKTIGTNVRISWNPSWVPSYFETFEQGDEQWTKLTDNWRLIKYFQMAVPSTNFVSSPKGESVAILKSYKAQNSHINMWIKTASSSSGIMSLYARYIDSKNYYGLELDNAANKVEVYKVVNGKRTTLNTHTISRLKSSQFYLLSFSVCDSNIKYFLDRTLKLKNIKDETPLMGEGHIGLYTDNQEMAFDKIDIKTNQQNEKYNIYASNSLEKDFVLLAREIQGHDYEFQNDKKYKYFKMESLVDGKISHTTSYIATLQ